MATHLYHGYGLTWLGPLAGGGFTGVYIFFVLSGYLLSRPFMTGPVDLRRYAVARVARLAPGYYLIVAVLVVTGIGWDIAERPWAAVFVATNVTDLMPHATFGQSWTLGVEVAFYAVLPVLARIRWWPALLIGSYLLWLVLRDPWSNQQLPVLFWSFGLGMLAARWQDRLMLLPRLWPVGFVLLAAGIVLSSVGNYRHDLTALGTAVLIVVAVRYRPRLPFARWPADLSYGIYLWHIAVMLVLSRMGASGVGLAVLSVAGTVIVAWTSYVFVERPVLRWSRKLHAPHGEPNLAGSLLPALVVDERVAEQHLLGGVHR